MRPLKGTYPVYLDNYIPKAKGDTIIEALNQNLKDIKTLFAQIPPEKADYSYAEGKWTLKQLILHLIDTERIFAYRALRFARKDPQQPLAFDEDHYAANSDFSNKTLGDLEEEFGHVRKSTMSLYKSFSKEILLQKGSTTMGEATVLSIGFAICGHAEHHLNVIKEKYL